MNRRLLLLLACLCGLSVRTAPAALTDPAQIQTEAYVNLVQADQSLDAGRMEEALAQYQAARDYYFQLAKDFPGWEPRIVQYRKTYCDNQIADIARRQKGGLPEELAELPPESAPVSTPQRQAPAPERPLASERSVEIDYLKSRIASLETELAEFDTLQNETETLTVQNEQLRKDLNAANQQLVARADAEQTVLEGLRAELDDKNEQIQGLQKEVEAKKQLDQALNDMEAKVNDLRAQNERLDKEIKTLDGELDAAEVSAEKAEAKQRKAEDRAKQAEEKLKDRDGLAKRLEKAEDKLKEAEDRAKMAEKEAKMARDDLAYAEKELSAIKRKPLFERPPREKAKVVPAEQTAEQIAEEPKAEPQQAAEAPKPESAVVASADMAMIPPRDVPGEIPTADYVRQLLQDGKNEAALAAIQEARRVNPSDINLTLIEGIALIRLQRYSESASLLIDLAKDNPRNPEVHATLGAAMMGSGFYEEARETLQMAIKLDKNLPECHYNLAQLYAFIDPIDLKLARRYYKQARDLGLAADPQLDKALK